MILSDHWYKNAILYSLNVGSFQDSDGDGIGDFRGLTRRLDYLAGLGVDCLWILPFYPSPMRDDGYDVMDYYGVDPRYGTLGDFVEFVREAQERGIRVLVDLVVNHTSNQHPWFQWSRSSAESAYRQWYVWRKEKPKEQDQIAFPGEQTSEWSFDEQANAWYLHHFYDFQPDLNLQHEPVRDEIKRIMGFWLQLGVSGFRVDAAPFLIEDRSERSRGGDEAHYGLLTEMREFVDRRRGDAIFLAEANVPLDRVGKYFGNADRFQMVFAFYLNQMTFLAVVREDARVLADALKRLPQIPFNCQWGAFLRSHDDLSLNQLSPEEQRLVMERLAPEANARIYTHGIRRRLAPMMKDDRRLLLLFSLLFTLPGAPVLRYGEEIGMGDDLKLQGREAVRTVMQWTDADNAGFSTADSGTLWKPVISDGQYGYKTVNVRRQESQADSLLRQIQRMIHVRRLCPEFGWGKCRVLQADGPLLAHSLTWRNERVLAIHNLADRPATLRNLSEDVHEPELHDLLAGEERIDPGRPIELGPLSFRWLRGNRPIIEPVRPG